VHHVPAHLHVEKLVDAPDLKIGVDLHGVQGHDDRIQQLGQREPSTGIEALAEVLTLQ
jgi:hypothetical protein